MNFGAKMHFSLYKKKTVMSAFFGGIMVFSNPFCIGKWFINSFTRSKAKSSDEHQLLSEQEQRPRD